MSVPLQIRVLPDVAAPELHLVGIHLHADEERRLKQAQLALAGILCELVQHRHGRTPVDLEDDVLLAARDEHRLADGTTSLGDDRVDLDVARESETDESIA